MGSVYLAHDTVLDRSVAVKFVGNVAPDAEDRERFLVEARAVARIQHPNVMVIYRVGELEGHPYLITEYIRGKNLTELTVPLPWRKALELAIGLARGLATAHRMGVLHRDIKLANAVLSEDGEVKLLDFSLAKLLEPTMTESAPERMDSAAASLRGDLGGRAPHGRVEADRADRPHGRDGQGRGARRGRAVAGRRRDPQQLAAPLVAADAGGHAARHAALHGAGAVARRVGDPAQRRVRARGGAVHPADRAPPTEANSPVELATRVQEQEPRPLLERAPRVDPRLAAIIDKCLRRDPFERFASADELRSALELLTPMGRELAIPEGNPYRGLQAFEAQHRALFFGRAAEIRTVVERLRSDPLVVVAGDSGAGKSSLCRAGVLPLLEEGVIEPGSSLGQRRDDARRYPLQTLQATLSTLFDMTEETVQALIQGEPDALVRGLRKQLGEVRGRLLFIDQLEELTTLGEARETEKVGHILARLASGIPGLRVLTTVRGDFLTRVAQIPGLGDEIGRSIYLLRPLSPEGAREAIVGPAQTKGVSFETEALVEDLIQAGSRGSLPLLQFALAELWEIRDKAAAVIGASDLTKIGGVTGALARHADGALAQLLPAQRRAGRRVLMRLVTIEETRASLTEDELVAGEAAAKTALGALIHARLVVVREVGDRVVYEIAHEALLAGWSTLRGWLDEERESRAVRHRLELAVDRLGAARAAQRRAVDHRAAQGGPLLDPRRCARASASSSRRARRRWPAARRCAGPRWRRCRSSRCWSTSGVWLHGPAGPRGDDRRVRAGGRAGARGQGAAAERSRRRSASRRSPASTRATSGKGEKLVGVGSRPSCPGGAALHERGPGARDGAQLRPDARGAARAPGRRAVRRALLAERCSADAGRGAADAARAVRPRRGAPGPVGRAGEPAGGQRPAGRDAHARGYEVDADRRRVARPRPGFTSGRARSSSAGLVPPDAGRAGLRYGGLPWWWSAARSSTSRSRCRRPRRSRRASCTSRRGGSSTGRRRRGDAQAVLHEPAAALGRRRRPYLIAGDETTYADYITFLEGAAAGERATRLPARAPALDGATRSPAGGRALAAHAAGRGAAATWRPPAS
jgi:hypothetical protein